MDSKLVIISVLIFITYAAPVQDMKLKQNHTKIILLWNSFFDSLDYGFGGFGDAPFKENNCEYTNCYLTKDHSSLLEASAVVFHAPTFNEPSQAWSERLPHQRYVFFSMESPENCIAKKSYDFFFNWTITYRTDSDIILFYGEIKKREIRIKNQFKNSTKNNWVAWMVSNCFTSSGREDYVKELSKHIPIEIYGDCGSSSCPKSRMKQCYEMIEKDYKFYLSFENSLCKDYVTEKLFNVLQYDIIPVVYGAADYDRILPANSYINAMNHSPEELANILKEIGNDPSKYKKYLMWKEDYYVNFIMEPPFCKLCKKLHTDSENKVYEDFKKWWVDGSKCRKGPVLHHSPVHSASPPGPSLQHVAGFYIWILFFSCILTIHSFSF
ncbi:alpha-(1,3)-fucosyltransferase C-like [Artemia franciscana]|uniref:alpha-(1,3)-fucosyltransferase C-like n=1 Tax=Artemia franciscana TaxID=6661 RepID=UPI0032DBC42D